MTSEAPATASQGYAGLANGAMFRDSGLRMADVADGLSNTVFAGERSPNLSDAVWLGACPVRRISRGHRLAVSGGAAWHQLE